VLKPGGRAIFHETLWDNPLINFARRWTMAEGDAGDAHLTERLIREFGRQCNGVEIHKRNIFYMLKRLSKLPPRDLSCALIPRPFWKVVKKADHVLIRMGLSRFCGEGVVVYTR
jgi:hypothetical protein